MLAWAVFRQTRVALTNFVELRHRVKRLFRATCGQEHGISVILRHESVVLQLEVFEHIRLLQVCLVEVQELSADELIVLRCVFSYPSLLFDTLLQLVATGCQLLLHHLEVSDLLVELD